MDVGLRLVPVIFLFCYLLLAFVDCLVIAFRVNGKLFDP